MTEVEIAASRRSPGGTRDRSTGANSEGESREWTEHRLEPLSNYPYYELRDGDYRAITTWDRDEDVLIVEAVCDRRNVYDPDRRAAADD